MKIRVLLCLLAGGLLVSGCGWGGNFDTHEFKPVSISRSNDVSYLWDYAELNENGEDFLISVAPWGTKNNMVLLKDQSGKALSQLNFSYKVRGIKVLEDPRNGRRWLFTTINDQKNTVIYAYGYLWGKVLDRDEKSFESIQRTDSYQDRSDIEWYGMICPILLEDIDQDGRPELVCCGSDALTHNPRGLIVYDFDSGRIKWRYDLNTTLWYVLVDDFDDNGSKEIVCANIAYKNAKELINGMNDFHGWLLVLDSAGKPLYKELVFDDFGATQLIADDIDRDGKKDIVAVQTTWGKMKIPNEVYQLNWNGHKLVRGKKWSFSGNFEQNSQDTFYNTMDAAGTKLFLLAARNSPLIALDKEFKPIESKFKDTVKFVLDVDDLDQDGSKEILLQTADNRFVILDKNLKKKAELANPFGNERNFSASIVHTGSGRPNRIALVSPTETRYYDYAGVSVPLLAWRWFKTNAVWVNLLLVASLFLFTFALLHRNRIFKATVDSLQEGIVVLGSKFRVVHINRYLLELLRDEKGKLPERKEKCLQVLLPELQSLLRNFGRSSARESTARISLGKEQIRHTVVLKKLRGLRRKYLAVLKPENLGQSGFNDKLAWAENARRLSHSVRRHISNLLLALQPLQENASTGEQKKYTDIIRQEVDEITVFTRAFQRFTEIRDMDLKLQDVIPSVAHCLEHIPIPENVRLLKNWQLKSVEAYIEPIRFEEALTNLVNNALEAMPGGGTLQLSVREFPGHAGPNGKLSVLVEVEDSGKGIPQAYQEEIWQLFFTTKQAGTGIGLPDTKKLIDSMGGLIVVESEEGKGTVVSLWLKGKADG